MMWHWHKGGYTDQQNRIKGPEGNPCICGQIIFNTTAHGERVEPSISDVGKTGYPHAKEQNRTLTPKKKN